MKTRSRRQYTPLFLFLAMLACGLPGAVLPESETTGGEATAVVQPESIQPTATTVGTGEEPAAPTATQPPETTTGAEPATPTAPYPPIPTPAGGTESVSAWPWPRTP